MFAGNALFRKELLWFRRDPSAVVQCVLVPLVLAATLLVNMDVPGIHFSWNLLCGAAVLTGTYFLLVLGPKTLASEGNALWIALTWPTGLEGLLKAKARLWSGIASSMVGLGLIVVAILFPANLAQIAIVSIGWLAFSRTLAEKMVTLVTVPTSSGEHQPAPRERVLAAHSGMLTFSIGVMIQDWALAFKGIAYSALTSAAMWQNLRARLPYLCDPWSEPRPKAPTLMHAMISISPSVDIGAVLALAVVVSPIAQVMGKGVPAWLPIILGATEILVCLAVLYFLNGCGVSLADIVRWNDGSLPLARRILWSGAGIIGGVAVGGLALGYQALLHSIPLTSGLLEEAQKNLILHPGLHRFATVLAIAIAPFTEEFLFRGLLYRALDREWGGMKAVFGSAVFFAIYHSPLAWLPVALVGTANALLFRKSGWMGTAVLPHIAYNTVVTQF